jgi:hypothetical protein
MDDPPRYQPLRALPAAPYVPGRGTRPISDDQVALREPLLGAARWAEQAEYLWGVDLYNGGFFWEAHEAWERLWRASEPDTLQHAYLQGLIQCTAACLKITQHEPDAAQRIAARALAHLAPVHAHCAGPYMGLDLARFCDAFRDFVDSAPIDVASRPHILLES